MQYRIGEFADLSGVSVKTLRFYDEIGLLRPASVDSRTRYRLYLPQQLQELASILALKDVGVPLADIRNLTRKTGPGKERHEVLSDLKRTLEQSIEKASQSLDWINAALEELVDVKDPIPVVVKRRPAALIASVCSRVEHYAEIERFERELLNELPAQSLGDLRGVLWRHCADSGWLEGEPFVALKERVPARSAYELKQLPAATLACAYCESDDLSAERAYGAIRRWMSVRGYQLAGPKREIYVGRMLEIQFPFSS
jgi:DNA-binding transcriptional MerR regulator